MSNKVLTFTLGAISLLIMYLYITDKVENSKASFNNLGYDYDFIKYENIENYKIKKPNNSFRIMVYIYELGCLSCNKYVINKINELYHVHSKLLRIKVVGGSRNYISQLGGVFKYDVIENPPKIFGKDNFDKHPFVLVIDKKGYLQNVHLININSNSSTDVYFNLLNSFMSSLE